MAENKTGQFKFRKRAQKERKKNAFISMTLSMIIPTVIVVAAFLICFFPVYDDVHMSGPLQGKDNFLVNRLSYILKNPMPGDVVCYEKDGTLKIGRILFTPESGIMEEIMDGKLYFSDGVSENEKYILNENYLDESCLFGTTSKQTGYFILPDDRGSIPLVSDNDVYDKSDIHGKIVFAWGNLILKPDPEQEKYDKNYFLFENKTAEGVVNSEGEYISNTGNFEIEEWRRNNSETCSLHGITVKTDIPVNTPIHIYKEDGSDLLSADLSCFTINREDGLTDIIFELPNGYQGKYRMTFGMDKKSYIILETEERKSEE